MSNKKNKASIGLGKGLGALIPPNVLESKEKLANAKEDDGSSVNITAFIELSRVSPNPFQPRKDFGPEALDELVRSIREHGVIQAITVRRVPGGGYELIAGERRVRASLEAGLEKIPAYIVDITTDEGMMEVALIENVQRENLNPIEIALGYQQLMELCNLTQEDVAEKVGKDRSTVANFLRLLRLPSEIQEALRVRQLTMGHARALLAVQDAEAQKKIFQLVVDRGLSVRQTEQLAKNFSEGKISSVELEELPVEQLPHVTATETGRPAGNRPAPSGNGKIIPQFKKSGGNTLSAEVESTIDEIEDRLRQLFATQVRIRTKEGSSGTVEVDFYSIEELERLLDLFAIIERAEMGK